MLIDLETDQYRFCCVFRSLFSSEMAQNVRVKFSLQQRVFLLKQFYCLDRDYGATEESFTERWPDIHFPNRNYMVELAKKFEETGSVQDAKRSGRPRSLRTEENTMIIAQNFVENTHRSANRTSLELEIPSRTLRRIMKDIGLHFYRPHLLQELKPQDHLPRIMKATNPCGVTRHNSRLMAG